MTTAINMAGLWLPVKVLMCQDIRGHEVLLFGQIYALSGNPRGCYASNDYFAELLKLAKSTVSEYIKGLQEKGLIDILQGRDEAGHPERQIFLTARGAQLYAPDTPMTAEASPAAGSAGRTGQVGRANGPVRPGEGENKDLNISHTRTREAEFEDLRKRVYEAAGEALADPAAYPEIAVMRDLSYLLVDLPHAPACQPDEIVDAARVLGKWFLDNRGARSMTSFRQVRKRAIEFRDQRLAGVPVTVKAQPRNAGIGDPVSFDDTKWRSVIRLANSLGEWKVEWGEPPGAAGSKVPDALVELWKGEVA